MSANKTRRTKQQAHRQQAYAMDQVPKVIHKGRNVPFAHRLCRKSPKEMRKTKKNVAGMVDKWKSKYYNTKGLGDLADKYILQGPDLEGLREIVKCEILGPFGMDSFEVIQNIHTPKGFQNMMSTPLCWKMSQRMEGRRSSGIRPIREPTSLSKAWSSGTCTCQSTPLIFGRTCSRKRAVAHQALVMAAKGAVVYTLAPHQALVRVGLARARPPIPTHHGSNSMGQACTQR